MKFQSEAGLVVDGVAGQRTWAALEASRGAKPKAQKSKGEDLTDKVRNASAVIGTASGAAAGVNEVIPPDALNVIYIIAAVAIAGAALLYAWRKLA